MASNFLIILFFLVCLNLLFSSSSRHVQDLESNKLGDNSSDVHSILHNKTKFSALTGLTTTYAYLCGRAGYITPSDAENERMFYFFFESRNSPRDPVLIWLNGGPGISSSVGLFYESGPLRIADDLSLMENKYGWDKVSNILYIDQPIGTGFSDGYIKNNRVDIANDLYNFLQKFFRNTVNEKYVKNDFFIVGQSYAAHYASSLAMRIKQEKVLQRPGLIEINLVGIAIGNPFTDLKIQIPTIPEFADSNNLITSDQYLNILKLLPLCLKSIDDCRKVNNVKKCNTAYTNCEKVYEQTVMAMAFNELNENPWNIEQPRANEHNNYDYSSMESLLNHLSTKLHVNNIVFHTSQAKVFHALRSDWAKSSQTDIAYLLNDGIKFLSYNGVKDLRWNHIGTLLAANQLTWDYDQEFIAAPVEKLVVNGIKVHIKKHKVLTYATVDHAGNSVSRDQPEIALSLIDSWMKEAIL